MNQAKATQRMFERLREMNEREARKAAAAKEQRDESGEFEHQRDDEQREQ